MRSTWWSGLFLVVVLTMSAAATATDPDLMPPAETGPPVTPDHDEPGDKEGATPQGPVLDHVPAPDPEPAVPDAPHEWTDIEAVDAYAWETAAGAHPAAGTTTPALIATIPRVNHGTQQDEQDERGKQNDQDQTQTNQTSPGEERETEAHDEPARPRADDILVGDVVSLLPTPIRSLVPDIPDTPVGPSVFDAQPDTPPSAAPATHTSSPRPHVAAAPQSAPDPQPSALIAVAGVAAVAVAATGTAAGGPSALLAWLRRVFWLPLYARVAKDKVLDHGTRQELLDRLRASPGSCVAELHAASGVSLNTIRHHLRVMQANGVVTSVKQGRRRCFFPIEVGWSREDRLAAAAISARAPRRVFRVIKSQPGIAQRELAAVLGVAPTSVAFHVRRLQDAGVVRAERAGRVMMYYPSRS